MVGKAQKNRGRTLMERAIAYENAGICVVCNRKIKKDKLKAMKIDGFWICGSNCIDKFLKSRRMWTPEGWVTCPQQRDHVLNRYSHR